MLRTDFNKKLGVELYKKAAYLDNKPKTRQALIKVARAIYNGRDASFAIRTYFQPKQRKQAADVVNCVAHRIKKTGAVSDQLLRYLGKVLPAGKRWGGKALDWTRGAAGNVWGSKAGKGILGAAGAGAAGTGVYALDRHASRVGAAQALADRDKQMTPELQKLYNESRRLLTAQGAGGAPLQASCQPVTLQQREGQKNEPQNKEQSGRHLDRYQPQPDFGACQCRVIQAASPARWG